MLNRIKLRNIKNYISARNIFVALGVSLIFFIAIRPPTDPDMGWHLQDGKYLIEHNFKVAKKDIFSYTVPDFPLIMHEWTTDIFMEKFLENTNFFFLSVLFALITSLAFLLVSLGASAKIEYKVIAAALGTIASVPVLGVRPQMLSLLGLALVVYAIFRFRRDHRSSIIYWLPLIFAVWVNVHGGFAVGLFFIGLFIAVEFLKLTGAYLFKKIGRWKFFFSYHGISSDDRLIGKAGKSGEVEKPAKRFSLKLLASVCSTWIAKLSGKLEENSISLRSAFRLVIIFFVSLFATLLNPYGWRVYIEVLTTAMDSYAKANINEWFPVTIANPMSHQFIIYLSLLAILLLFSFKKTDYTYLAISLAFLYLGFSSWRHMPLFLIVSTPLWISITEGIAGSELLNVVRKKWFLAAMALAVFLIAQQKMTKVIPFSFSLEKLAGDGNYPFGAVNYLKENPIEGRMFNEYNWGGYLIWQYPEKKVFIDGRMPSWRMGDQKIFEEFNGIFKYEENWQDALEKYDVSFALIYNNPPNKIMFSRSGWKEVYSDQLSIIFLRPEKWE
jgi:hypothetical protein